MITRLVTTCVFLVLPVGVFAQPQTGAIPDRFLFRGSDDVIWVSESAATASDGRVRPGVMSSEWHKEVLWRRDSQARARGAAPVPDACAVEFFGATDSHDAYTVATLAELRAAAATHTVFTGIVTATAAGWHRGMPHTVIRIVDGGRVVYLLYPVARVRHDDMMVCNADPEYAAVPGAGDRIVFVAPRPIDATGSLFVTSGSWILYEHAAKLVAGPTLKDDAALQSINIRAITDYLRPDSKQ
jgi:hypothetical protein